MSFEERRGGERGLGEPVQFGPAAIASQPESGRAGFDRPDAAPVIVNGLYAA